MALIFRYCQPVSEMVMTFAINIVEFLSNGVFYSRKLVTFSLKFGQNGALTNAGPVPGTKGLEPLPAGGCPLVCGAALPSSSFTAPDSYTAKGR